MKNIFFTIIVSALLIATIYGLWLVGKWMNYKLAYEDGVKTTVEEMVKPECLQ